MVETTETDKSKPLKLSRPGRLELKKTVETGQVKQSFSHGRSKNVTVEVKRKRTYAPGAGGTMTEVKAPPPPPEAVPEPEVAAAPATQEAEAEAPERRPVRQLTDEERALRIRVLEEARKAAELAAHAEEARTAEEAIRTAREVAAKAEEEELSRLKEIEGQRRGEEEARLKADEEQRALGEQAAQRAASAEKRRRETAGTPVEESAADAGKRKAKTKPAAATPAPARPRGDDRRRGGKLTISQALDGGSSERVRSVAAFRRRVEREKRARTQPSAGPAQKVLREVVVPESITVGELANRMAERGGDVVKALMKMGVMATINQAIDADTAELVVSEFGHSIKRVSAADVEIGLEGAPDAEMALKPRAPVVTVMGHVDHGKTSLLDALRETDVVSREVGGITQHIGAYRVKMASGDQITFIDTPGHAAFTSMRQRGAKVTDLVVLVVAADDGVQPQTVEAINHARAAEVPIIVAINKCDRPESDPDRIRNELLSHEVVVESVGGEVQAIEVSALKKEGLDKLEEAILLQAELLELTANPERDATGTVIEAQLNRGRGPVATVLVQRGTLKVGDIFIAGPEWGRVRALVDDHGDSVEEAGPSTPVEVLGLNGTPQAGDDFAVVDSESRAREVTEFRQDQIRDRRAAAGQRSSLEQMFGQLQTGEAAQVPVVVKGDVQGSVEAIVGALDGMATEEVKVLALHSGVGGVTESDVSLAGASNGIVIGFNVRANPQARELAKRDNVEIRYYSVIYDVVEDVKAMMSGKLAPKVEEEVLGRAEIREVFNITKVGRIAGCMVTDGVLRRGARARLLRDDVVVHTGTLGSLKRFKEDAREVRDGYECGTSLENYNDIQQGDVLECFEVKETARAL